MSNNSNDDKTLRDDEAFIDALYQGHGVSLTEQPSIKLDQQVLAAAHKAVNAKPSLVLKHKKAWYFPIASAASMLLVFSLVLNQQELTQTSLNESSQNLSNSTDNADLLIAEKDLVLAQTSNFDAIDQSAMLEQKVARTNSPDKAYQRKLSTGHQIANSDIKVETKVLKANLFLTKNSTNKKTSDRVEQRTFAFKAKKQESSMNNSVDSDRLTPLIDQAIILSRKAFHDHQQQHQLHWRLIKENDENYWITLLLPQNNRIYILPKSFYKIPSDSSPVAAQRLLTVIELNDKIN
jgi:hypothetical protein